MRPSRPLLALAAVTAGGAALLGAGLRPPTAGAADVGASRSTAVVTQAAVQRTLSFQGTVEFRREAELASLGAAVVTEIAVRPGERVRAGALLVAFDQATLAAERAESAREGERLGRWLLDVYPAQRASLAGEAETLRLKLDEEERALVAKLRALHAAKGEGLAGEAEVRGAERELAAARAAATGARATRSAQLAALEHQRLEAALNRSGAGRARSAADARALAPLRAPFDGLVTAVSVAADARGTPVAPGTHLISLVDTGSFVVQVPVPAAEVYRLSMGHAVSCHLPRRGTTTACVLLGVAKAETGYVARFALAPGAYERGEAGDVRLVLQGPADALAVPIAALARRGGVVGVRVAGRNGSTRFVPVATRFFGEARVAVDGVLRPGNRVLLGGDAR